MDNTVSIMMVQSIGYEIMTEMLGTVEDENDSEVFWYLNGVRDAVDRICNSI